MAGRGGESTACRPASCASVSTDSGLRFDQHPDRVCRRVGDARSTRRTAESATWPRCSSGSACAARSRSDVERFTREMAPLVLNGPPSVTGFAGGRPKVEEVVAYWPALIDKRVVRTTGGDPVNGAR